MDKVKLEDIKRSLRNQRSTRHTQIAALHEKIAGLQGELTGLTEAEDIIDRELNRK